MANMTYVKLFEAILDSSVWQESKETRLVWITMLAMKDRNGVVNAAVPGLADRAKVTVTECVDALRVLSAPDEWSRSKEYDGRRIKEVPGGWLVLNHAYYRDKMGVDERREYQRVKQAEYREKKKTRPALPKDAGDCNDLPARKKELTHEEVTAALAGKTFASTEELSAELARIHGVEEPGDGKPEQWRIDRVQAKIAEAEAAEERAKVRAAAKPVGDGPHGFMD